MVSVAVNGSGPTVAAPLGDGVAVGVPGVAFVGAATALGRVAALADALVGELATLSLAGAEREALRGLIVGLGHVRAGVDAAEARALVAVDALGDGGVDSLEVLRRGTGCSQRMARRSRLRAAVLAKMPRVGAALAVGDISAEHVDALVRAAEAISPEAVDSDSELLEQASGCPADLAARRIQAWVQRRLHPDDAHKRHQRHRKARRLSFGENDDGMPTAYAAFDQVQGAEFRSLIDRIADRLWRNEGGRDNPNSRSIAQRRLDALIIACGLEPPAPPSPAPAPDQQQGQPANGRRNGASPQPDSRPAPPADGRRNGASPQADSRSTPSSNGRRSNASTAPGPRRAASSDGPPDGASPASERRPAPSSNGYRSGARRAGEPAPGRDARDAAAGRGGGEPGPAGGGRCCRNAADSPAAPAAGNRPAAPGDGGPPLPAGGVAAGGGSDGSGHASTAPDCGFDQGSTAPGGGFDHGSIVRGGGFDHGSIVRGGGFDPGEFDPGGMEAAWARAATASWGRATSARHQIVVVASSDVISGADPNGRCEVLGAGPIPRSELERLACDAEIFGVVFGGKGEPLWAGRRTRTATEAQRRALMARDGACVLCAAHYSQCDAHHIVPWAKPGCGPTDIDNLALLCGTCHRRLHDSNRILVRRRDRAWSTAPDPRHSNQPVRAAKRRN